MSVVDVAATAFDLPHELEAAEPPEARGLARDEVKLLVSRPGRIEHLRFDQIDRVLDPGDLVVVNTSATLPAAIDGTSEIGPVIVHFSSPLEKGHWSVELREPDLSGPLGGGSLGMVVHLSGGGELTLIAPHPAPVPLGTARLWRVEVDVFPSVEHHLRRFGRPIAYSYLRGTWPLPDYQTVFATDPGSAEMPSAGRPFSERLVTRMVARGILFAPITLHSAVSSFEVGERPEDERFRVTEKTADLVNRTREAGGRIVAVGTTTTRALETVALPDGTVVPGEGRTDLILGPHRAARTVNALITGWHAPQATHLSLLEAVAGIPQVQGAYDLALRNSYLWHEFGDACLLLSE